LSDLEIREAVIAHKLITLEEEYFYELFKKNSRAQIEAMSTEMKNKESNKRKESYDASRSIPGRKRKEKIDFFENLVNIEIGEKVDGLIKNVKKIESAFIFNRADLLFDALGKDDSIRAKLKYARGLHYRMHNELIEEKKKQIISLANNKNTRAMGILVSFLDDPDEAIRSTAEKEILKNGESSIHPLVEDLSDKNSNTRWRSAWILGKIKEREENVEADEKVIRHLIGALPDHDPELRISAVWALTEYHDKRIIAPILETCADEDRGVEIVCKEALVKLQWYEKLSGAKANAPEQSP
jgi:hypothetical protein